MLRHSQVETNKSVRRERQDEIGMYPERFLFLGTSRSTNARDALHPAVTSEFPIRQVLKRVSERNAFTSTMRAKWNEKLSALLFPSCIATLLRYYVDFVVLARLSRVAFAFETN